MEYAPIVLFVFNRPELTRITVEALKKNRFAKESDLFIYADAPRGYQDILSVSKVRSYIHKIKGFKSVTITERDENWGLAKSIEFGISEIVNKYEKVIIVEDDIQTSPGFLKYMNDALEMYEQEDRVMHIAGFIPPIDNFGLPETFFIQQPQLWGWATWKRAWKHYEKDAEKLLKKLDQNGEITKFNIDDSFDFYDHLASNVNGRLKTWGIKWQTSMFLRDGLVLAPKQSITRNIGHDGSGIHSGIDATFDHVNIAEYIEVQKIKIEEDLEARQRFVDFWIIGRRKEQVFSEHNLKGQVKFLTKRVLQKLGLLEKVNDAIVKTSGKIKNKKTQLAGGDDSLIDQFGQLYYYHELLPKVKQYKKSYPKSDKLKNIVQISAFSSRGGAALISRKIYEEMKALGYSSKMLVGYKDSDNPDITPIPRESGVTQENLTKFQEKNDWPDFFHLSSFKLPEYKNFAYSNIVHYHNLHINFFSKFAMPYLTSLRPSIWTLHDEEAISDHAGYSLQEKQNEFGFWESSSLNSYPAIKTDTGRFISKNKKLIYENSDFTVVGVSKWMADRAKNSALGDKDIRMIYNGIDMDTFKALNKATARTELGLPIDKKILMFSANQGTKNSFKGGSFIINAYEKLKHREDILFISIGGDKGEKESWKDIGYVSDRDEMAKYYSAADLFIYPTLADTFGLVVAEALACNTPVVSFNTHAIPELISHKETGYLARHKDIDDFLAGIEYFIDEPALLERAQALARSSVVDRFSDKRMIKEYEELYLEIFEKSKKHMK